MKIFEVYSYEIRTASYEDPNCPSFWRGSGCYDIDVNTLQYKKEYISAINEESAKNILLSESPELIVLGIKYGYDDDSITKAGIIDWECGKENVVDDNYEPSFEDAKYYLDYGRI